MSRGTFIYVVMLAVFGAGLWAILSFGSLLLRAPEDLSGEWQLFEPGAAGPDDEPVKTMSVDQSGQFFKVRMNGHVMDMKLIEEQLRTRRYERVGLVLNGKTARFVFDGIHNGDVFDVSATGAIKGTWLARRTSRQYGAPAHVPRQPPLIFMPIAEPVHEATTAPTTAPATTPETAPATGAAS